MWQALRNPPGIEQVLQPQVPGPIPSVPYRVNIERTLDGDFKIQQTGFGTFNCWSESEIGVCYAVDIMAFSVLGSCTCLDFETRRFPRWKMVQIPFDHFRCKHLRAVRSHALNHILSYHNKNDS